MCGSGLVCHLWAEMGVRYVWTRTYVHVLCAVYMRGVYEGEWASDGHMGISVHSVHITEPACVCRRAWHVHVYELHAFGCGGSRVRECVYADVCSGLRGCMCTPCEHF